jgi:hypothetical protein
MTQEIIQMARDSGMELYGLGKDRARFVHHLEAFANLVAAKALSDPMREVQRLGQEIEQESVAWPCLIDSADFSANTITIVMQCEDYKVSAGTHWLSTTSPKKNT